MLTIREARPEDYGRVSELTLAAYGSDGFIDSEHGYTKLLADVESRARAALVLVATDGAGVVGAVTYCSAGSEYAEISRVDEAEFRMLAVDPRLRGQRIGEALVRECQARAQINGRRALVLSVDRRNRAAARLYLRLGFVREPDRDWSPVADVNLEVYRLDLPADD